MENRTLLNIINKSLLCVATVLSLAVSGCGGSAKNNNDNDFIIDLGNTSADPEVAQTVDLFLSWYLWPDELPSLNAENFSSVDEVVNTVTSAVERDRFSFWLPRDIGEAFFFSGELVGYGGHVKFTDDAVIILFTHNNGAFADNNLQRGDRIVSIDGESVITLLEEAQANGLSDSSIFGAQQEGTSVTATVERLGGLSEQITLTSSTYSINAVIAEEVIPQGDSTVGYIAYSDFLDTSEPELEATFEQFKAAGVDQLVLDLRYNGGGSLSITAKLASWINGSFGGQLFTGTNYNDARADSDQDYFFDSFENSLSIQNLVVIATSATCSASEAIVAGFEPYINVTVVGQTTCGKPVGMNLFTFDNVMLAPLTFQLSNSEGLLEYFSGISPDCSVADSDTIHALGDSEEAMLSAALNYLSTGQCSANAGLAKSSSQARGYSSLRSPAFSNMVD